MNTTEATIDIAAPPDVVWFVLTEWADYAEWNPFIINIEGMVAPGQDIRVRFKFWRGSVKLRAEVTRVIPGAELAWTASLPVRGLFDREHLFRIDSTGGGSRLRQTQMIFGIFCPLVSLTLAGTVRRGLTSMNTSIKRRAEAIVRLPTPASDFVQPARARHLT